MAWPRLRAAQPAGPQPAGPSLSAYDERLWFSGPKLAPFLTATLAFYFSLRGVASVPPLT